MFHTMPETGWSQTISHSEKLPPSIGSHCPGILALVLGPGRPYFSPIVCPGSKPDGFTVFTTGDQTEAYHV